MVKKKVGLLRDFTGAKGEFPCDELGNALSPYALRVFGEHDFPIKSLPMAWLDGKPVYPDSPICWRRGVEERADYWSGWDDPECLAKFSWPDEGEGYFAACTDPDCCCAFPDCKQPEAKAPPAQDKRTAAIQSQLDIQGQDGNWNCDPYMHGMYNGLECALATLEGRAPNYREAPDEWLCDKGESVTVVDLNIELHFKQ